MLAAKKKKISNKMACVAGAKGRREWGGGGGGEKRDKMRTKTLLKDTVNTKPTIKTTYGTWGQIVLPISILVTSKLGTNFSN